MVMPWNGGTQRSWYAVCLVVCLVILVPAGAVTISQAETGMIALDDAHDSADATLVEFILSGSPGLGPGEWDDAVLGNDPVVIHDLNGQPLFYQYPVLKNGIPVGTIKTSASTVLPSSVAAIGLKPPYWTDEEATRTAEAFLLQHYPGSDVLSTSLVCYSYPKIGQTIRFIPGKGSAPQEIILDISTGEPVDDTATWSYYRAIPETAIIKNRDQWMKERAIDSTVLAEARKGTLERPSSLQDIDFKTLAGTLHSTPEYGTWIDQRFNRDTTVVDTSEKAGTTTLPITLHPQQKDTWCTVATIQMIAEYYEYSFTQSDIAQKTDTTGSAGTYTSKEIAFFKDYVNQKDTHSDSSETFAEERAELSLSRPFDSSVYSGSNVHARVCAGYDDSWGRSRLYLYDPWPVNEGDIYWESFSDQIHYEDVFVKGGTSGPVAGFTYTVNGKTVMCTDTSSGSPTAWYWAFGDGTTDRTRNPSHTYANTGTYTITLTASNNDGTSSASSSVNIVPQVSAPVASFTYSVNGRTVTFTDTSTGSPTKWSWSFGDKKTSREPNPVHTFVKDGTYTVTLRASNSAGSSSTSSSLQLGTIPTIPGASFTYTVSGKTVTFTDTSTGSPTKWSWSFGDRRTSREQNPVHTFAKDGTYTITLRASNSAGSSGTSASVMIGAPASVPVASFTYTMSGKTVTFTDTSTGSPTKWSWSFGDRRTSRVQNPVHTYSKAGTYTVSLGVTNSAGSSGTSVTVKVGS